MSAIDDKIKEAESKRDHLEKLFSESIKINDPQAVGFEINKLNYLIHRYQEIETEWNKLPDNEWFKREDIDFDPLLLEEMVINGLVYKKIKEIRSVGDPESTFFISYHRL